MRRGTRSSYNVQVKTASICVIKSAPKNQLSALIEKGLVKLGNFRKNQNKRQYAYLLTPAGLEEKPRIAQAFLKRKEAEFEAIRREIEALKGELDNSHGFHHRHYMGAVEPVEFTSFDAIEEKLEADWTVFRRKI